MGNLNPNLSQRDLISSTGMDSYPSGPMYETSIPSPVQLSLLLAELSAVMATSMASSLDMSGLYVASRAPYAKTDPDPTEV